MIEYIFIAPSPGALLLACQQISLVAGRGIVGDRNFGVQHYPGQNLTLIAAEEIEAFYAFRGRPHDFALSRRNLVTRGVDLNALVGREFRIGNVRLRGVELCEPCASLGQSLADASFSAADVVRYWVGRGGLRADVLNDGEIALGDTLSTVTDARPATP